MNSKLGNGKKTPYRPPRLVAYGNFRTLTRAKGGTANDGGAQKPRTKASGPGS